jgi:hypothetical protein
MNPIDCRNPPMACQSLFRGLCLLAMLLPIGQGAARPGAVFGDEPAHVANTPADLDLETRRRYEEARQRLRQAERAQDQVARDAEAADPLLAPARQAELKARKYIEESRGSLAKLESQYAERGDAARKQFQDWRRCYSAQAALEYCRRLAADPRQRPLLVRFVEQELKMRANQPGNARPDLQALLPDKEANLKGDEALNAYLRIGEAEAAPADCAALEKAVTPTLAARQKLQRLAEARVDLAVYGAYAGRTMAVANFAATRKCTEIRNEVTAIWPAWAEYERELARRQYLARRKSRNALLIATLRFAVSLGLIPPLH